MKRNTRNDKNKYKGNHQRKGEICLCYIHSKWFYTHTYLYDINKFHAYKDEEKVSFHIIYIFLCFKECEGILPMMMYDVASNFMLYEC